METIPEGARCAIHPELPASHVCTRCGNYCCDACSGNGVPRTLCIACGSKTGAGHYGAASLPQRIVNLAIDTVAQFVLVIALSILMGVFVSEETLDAMPSLVLQLGVPLLYYVPLEQRYGRTLGKVVSRTRVDRMGGGRPGFGRAVARSLIRVVPFEPLSFVFAHRGWHDEWSGTRVVRLTPLVDDEQMQYD